MFNHSRMASRRLELGLTQLQCSIVAGVSTQQWSLWENGGASPNFSNVCMIARILDCGLEEFKDTDEPAQAQAS